MMNLNEWAMAIKYAGSKKGVGTIRRIIKEQCLSSQKKVCGSYQIDHQMLWDVLIANDLDCMAACKEKKINDIVCLESQFEELKYHGFWLDNKVAFSSKKR